jgi:hypothetical protein
MSPGPDNGLPYTNTEEAWTFLCDKAAKAGRWLGYVEFARISDERNAPAEVYVQPPEFPFKMLSIGGAIEIPTLVLPQFWCQIPEKQPCRLCLVGEKTSLKAVLQPIAESVKGELLLPTGEISDTMIAELAARAVTDERPTVVFYFSDFDPSGHQMPISMARKLQALRDLKYPGLDVQVFPVALTLEQVRELGLPSTPLKSTERRADRWREVMQHEQTEIDSLAALSPDTLREIVWNAIEPFYDRSLAGRVAQREREWSREANELLRAHPACSEACERLETALTAVQNAVEAFHETQESVRDQLSGIETSALNAPVAEVSVEALPPLFTTQADYITATRRLARHKALEGGG